MYLKTLIVAGLMIPHVSMSHEIEFGSDIYSAVESWFLKTSEFKWNDSPPILAMDEVLSYASDDTGCLLVSELNDEEYLILTPCRKALSATVESHANYLSFTSIAIDSKGIISASFDYSEEPVDAEGSGGKAREQMTLSEIDIISDKHEGSKEINNRRRKVGKRRGDGGGKPPRKPTDLKRGCDSVVIELSDEELVKLKVSALFELLKKNAVSNKLYSNRIIRAYLIKYDKSQMGERPVGCARDMLEFLFYGDIRVANELMVRLRRIQSSAAMH